MTYAICSGSNLSKSFMARVCELTPDLLFGPLNAQFDGPLCPVTLVCSSLPSGCFKFVDHGPEGADTPVRQESARRILLESNTTTPAKKLVDEKGSFLFFGPNPLAPQSVSKVNPELCSSARLDSRPRQALVQSVPATGRRLTSDVRQMRGATD